MTKDYTELFSKLGKWTIDKQLRQSKAILLLAVINLFEDGTLSDNEIRLDETLEAEYINLWHRLMDPYEKELEAYVPFWFLSADSFWHIVPFRNREDILELMQDSDQRPSKSKMKECINYAELDEDLYFDFTLSYGRDLLRKTLLNSHFKLSEDETFALTNLHRNKKPSEKPVDIEKLYSSLKEDPQPPKTTNPEFGDKANAGYDSLPLNIKIELNISFFSFLKVHTYDREIVSDVIPNIETLYDRIMRNPLKPEDCDSSFISLYDDLLKEVRTNLMIEDNAMGIIEHIDADRNLLSSVIEPSIDENVDNDYYEEESDEDYENSKTEDDSKETEPSIETQPSVSEAKEDNSTIDNEEISATPEADFFIEQQGARSYIYNKLEEKVYATNGRIKQIKDKLYRIYRSYSLLSINVIDRNADGTYTTGARVEEARRHSDLFQVFYDYDRLDDFTAVDGDEINGFSILFNGMWYSSDGTELYEELPTQDTTKPKESSTEGNYDEEESEVAEEDNCDDDETEEEQESSILETYRPKGKIAKIKNETNNPYDFLWMMAIAEMMGPGAPQSTISIDNLALMMIADAWETSQRHPEVIEQDSELKKCINFFISESKQYMDQTLDWNSPKDLIFSEIKDYPMGDEIEDIVDNLVSEAPYRIANVWIKSDNRIDVIQLSQEFYGRCLYGIHLRKYDSFIQINPGWIWNLHNEQDNLIAYFRELYRLAVVNKEETTKD